MNYCSALFDDMTAFRKEDVEKCKQKDLLEQMLKEMSGEFPELGRVFVKERDVYLTYSLQMATHHIPRRINSARKYCLRSADTLVLFLDFVMTMDVLFKMKVMRTFTTVAREENTSLFCRLNSEKH